MAFFDELFAGFDEWLFSRLTTDWRADIWQQTQRLLTASKDECSVVEADIFDRTSRIARLVSAFRSAVHPLPIGFEQ